MRAGLLGTVQDEDDVIIIDPDEVLVRQLSERCEQLALKDIADSDTTTGSDVELMETAGNGNGTDCLQLTFPENSVTQAQVSTIPAQGITKMKQRGILDYNFRCTFQKMMLY